MSTCAALCLLIYAFPTDNPALCPSDSPDRPLLEYCRAWAARDWDTMAKKVSADWLRAHPGGAHALADACKERYLHGYKIAAVTGAGKDKKTVTLDLWISPDGKEEGAKRVRAHVEMVKEKDAWKVNPDTVSA